MEARNCRNCLSHYEKQTGYWCEMPLTKDGKIVEPIGFCEFCDRNSRYFINKK